jgi:hypothetical protein
VDVGTDIPPSSGSDSSGHPGNSPLCLCSGPGRGGPDAASAVTAVRIGRGFPRSPPDGPRRFSYRDPTRTGDDVCPSGVEAVHAPQRKLCMPNLVDSTYPPCGVDGPSRATSEAQVLSVPVEARWSGRRHRFEPSGLPVTPWRIEAVRKVSG